MSALPRPCLAKVLLPKQPARLAAKSLRIGIMGLGNVGQAVARQLQQVTHLFHDRGFHPQIVAALVRDMRRPRVVPNETQRVPLFDDPRDFLRQTFDVVIELLGGIEPAYLLVGEFLRRGVNVVTANKSLLARHGEALYAISAHSRAKLRCEASAVAGVPFLDALRDRPFGARVESLLGIVNGTSNFILTQIEKDRCSLDQATRRAVQLGFAEPDPSFDLSGRDSAEKLVVLLQHLGVGGFSPSDIETSGVDALHPDDLAQARIYGGIVKPVVCAKIQGDNVEVFAGPCWLSESHVLASTDNQQNAVSFSGRSIGEVTFSGPGAGPDITAATVLDDVISTASGAAARAPRFQKKLPASPRTAWFLRVERPSGQANIDSFASHLRSHALRVRGLIGLRRGSGADRLFALIEPCFAAEIDAALAALPADAHCRHLRMRALLPGSTSNAI